MHYQTFWECFPEGKQTIHGITGNTDSSDFDTAFTYFGVCGEDRNNPELFGGYKDFADWIFEQKLNDNEFYFFCDIDPAFEDLYVECELRELVEKAQTPLELFTSVVNYVDKNVDPTFFIRKFNPFFCWLNDIRK